MSGIEPGAIPFTAWQQAVFVVLFVVMVVVLLYWFERQSKNWQKFTSERDEQWQKWLDSADTRTAAQLAALTAVIKELTENFSSHDKSTSDAIATMKERTARRARAQTK